MVISLETSWVVELEPLSWDENEEYNQANTDEDRDEQDHYGTLIHELADVGFSDAGPVHEGVLAEAGKGEDRIDGVLM